MARSGDRGDLLAAGLGPGPAREQSEISDDANYVAAARDGDRAAFGQLYQRYARMVHGVLLARSRLATSMISFKMSSSRRFAGSQCCATTQALGHGSQPLPATSRTTTTVDRRQRNH